VESRFGDIMRLLPPSSCGILAWRPGEAAKYDLTVPGKEPVTWEVHVLRDATPSDRYFLESGTTYRGQTWLLYRGLRYFRDVPLDVFRLASPDLLEIGPATPEFGWARKYFPLLIVSPPCERIGLQIQILPDTDPPSEFAGLALSGPCKVRRVTVADAWSAEVLLHPMARPLGLLKYESRHERVVFRGGAVSAPWPLGVNQTHLAEGRSSFVHGCESCHLRSSGGGPLVVPPR